MLIKESLDLAVAVASQNYVTHVEGTLLYQCGSGVATAVAPVTLNDGGLAHEVSLQLHHISCSRSTFSKRSWIPIPFLADIS